MVYIFPITAIHKDGGTRLLYSAQDVLDFLKTTYRHRWGSPSVGTEWNFVPDISDGYYYYRRTEVVTNDWILRDDRGRPVDYREFLPARQNYKNRLGDFEHRNGPVPGRCGYRGCSKFDAHRKRHGGRGVLARAEMHRREFNEDMGLPRIRRHFYLD